MRRRYNYPEMPGLFTGCEYADIDTQLRKASMEQAGRDVYDRNRCRCRYAPGARLPR